jgi:hypothetical protein
MSYNQPLLVWSNTERDDKYGEIWSNRRNCAKWIQQERTHNFRVEKLKAMWPRSGLEGQLNIRSLEWSSTHPTTPTCVFQNFLNPSVWYTAESQLLLQHIRLFFPLTCSLLISKTLFPRKYSASNIKISNDSNGRGESVVTPSCPR